MGSRRSRPGPANTEPHRRTFAEIGTRATQLANALRDELGIDGDQRVATLMWNNAVHVEAYLAIPSMGAVLHTLNLRLPPEQLAWIVDAVAGGQGLEEDGRVGAVRGLPGRLPRPAVTSTGTSAATAAWRSDCNAVRVMGPVSGSTKSAAGNAAIWASTSSRELTITGR
ncbi:hypothetical protein SMICM304S_07048 [Streptomyces microflavus]